MQTDMATIKIFAGVLLFSMVSLAIYAVVRRLKGNDIKKIKISAWLYGIILFISFPGSILASLYFKESLYLSGLSISTVLTEYFNTIRKGQII